MGALQSKTEKLKHYLEEEVLESIYPSPDAYVIKTTSKRPTKAAPQNVQRITLDAQPIQEKNEHVVNARDGREQVLTTAKWPYSAHGVVACKFKKMTSWGTGILIGPNIVLTAGHNLYNYKNKQYADPESIQFLPGMNGQALPFGQAQVDRSFVSPNYIKEEKEDYGILILKEPIGEVTGYFGLACLKPEEMKNKRINITGYPCDKVASKPNCYEMWGMGGEVSHVDQTRGVFSYLIDTEAGQSGSGVWYQEREDYYVCGVHVSGNQLVNTATLLTRNIYQQIHRWLQEASSKENLLRLKSMDLKELRFKEKEINVEGIALLNKYNLDDLRTVFLAQMKIGNEEAKALAQNTSWISLSELHLWSNNIGTEGAKALARNISWVNLSELFLSNNKIGPEGAKALSRNVSWANLSQLNLKENNIGIEGAKALAQNISWVKLLKLDLSQNNIGPEGAKALAQNTSWAKLSHLDLGWNNIGTEGAKGLAQNTSWVSLSELDLAGGDLDDEGARELAQNSSWINLYCLNLFSNRISAGGVKVLVQNKFWGKLSRLDLRENKVLEKEAKELEYLKKNLRVRTSYTL